MGGHRRIEDGPSARVQDTITHNSACHLNQSQLRTNNPQHSPSCSNCPNLVKTTKVPVIPGQQEARNVPTVGNTSRQPVKLPSRHCNALFLKSKTRALQETSSTSLISFPMLSTEDFARMHRMSFYIMIQVSTGLLICPR